MTNEKMPHMDRAIGVPEEQQRFEEILTKLYEQHGNTKIEGEIEKNERDLKIIDFVSNAVSEYQKRYGRKKEILIPIKKIHVLEDGGTEKFMEGKFSDGAHSSRYGSILADRKKSDIDFAFRVFHELFHLKSYKAFQLTRNEKEEDVRLESYRSGMQVTSRDGQTEYFGDLEEAVIVIMTEKFYREYILGSELFKQELVEIKGEPIFGRQAEKDKLEKLMEELWQKNQGQFKTKEEVRDLFIDAQINGDLLKIGRLIEKTFGKGSFRKLGEATDYDNKGENESILGSNPTE